MSASTIASEIGALAPRRRRRAPPSTYLAVAACEDAGIASSFLKNAAYAP